MRTFERKNRLSHESCPGAHGWLLCATIPAPGVSSEAQPILERDSLAFDFRAPIQKKIAQFRRVVITPVQRIESEKDFAAWRQVSLQIAQKKIPFRRPPSPLRRTVKIKIDRERGDPIELLTQIGQRLERFDPPNDARNTKKLKQLGKKRYPPHVEAKDRMTKPF